MNDRHTKVLLVAIATAVLLAGLGGFFWPAGMVRVEWVGLLFLDALKMLIVPLVVAAVISGVTSLGDVRKLGRLGGYTIGYYLVTTSVAVLIGLVVVNLIQPGVGLQFDLQELPAHIKSKQDVGVVDLLRSLVAPNIIKAAAETQLLPLIIFAIVFAAALTTVGEVGAGVIRFFDGLNQALMTVIVWLMYTAPIGIFGLVAGRLGRAGGGEAFARDLSAVGWHVVTVLSGLGLHFLFLFAVVVVLGKRRPIFFVQMLRALVTAFGTASSSATLPQTLECAKAADIDERVSRFVIPLGSTVNMDGTALYEAAAVMFIAQAYGLQMTLGQQAIIFVSATLAAIGAAGIPEAGLVTMVIVLSAVGLPLEGVGLLLAVDWFLDRFRTATNVWGDAVGAALIAKRLPQTAMEP